MIRIRSHAEIFSFAALKCLQSGNMDSRVFMEPLNPCLWLSWTPCPWSLYRLWPTTDETRGGHRIGAKGSLTSEAKLRLAPCTSKLLLTGRLGPFTRRLGLSSTIPCLRGLTRLLPLPESLGLNLARIRLSLKRLLLIRLISLTLVFY